MRNFFIGTIPIALLAAACAAPASVDAESTQETETPVSTSPATTSPVDASAATTSPVTTSPIATSDAEPSDESATPSEDQVGESGSAEQEPTVTTQPPKETSGTPPQPVEPHPSGPVAAAIADLAGRLGISVAEVTVVSVESVVWPDGSLGCPQPGMAYTQVQVDGALITLSVGGRTYEYHSGGSRDPFLCEKAVDVEDGGSVGSGGDEDF